MRVLVIVLLAACRIGFDPVTTTDASTSVEPSTCLAATVCDFECPIGEPCVVDCAGTTVCNVTCLDPAAGCSVINCGPTCELDCGDSAPIRTASTATCP